MATAQRRRERVSDGRLAEMVAKARKLDGDGKNSSQIGKKLRVSATVAYCLVNGCRNSREYERKLEERESYYSERLTGCLGEVPTAGYQVEPAKYGRKSLIIRFPDIEKGVIVREYVMSDFKDVLSTSENAVREGPFEPFEFKMVYKEGELKITPRGLEAKAFLWAFGKKVVKREAVEPE